METQKEILCRVNEILQIHDKVEKEKGEKFNYFSVLKIEKAEVKHSAFIAELLNPKGLHGQGNIFLNLFIDLIQYKDFNTTDAKVEIEKNYFCISYRKDILEWMEKCLQKCENKPVLFQSINQYINIIKKITNQISSKAMKEIHKVIRENLNDAKSIFEEYDNVLTDVSNELRDDVMKKLKTVYPEVKIEKKDAFSWASSIFIDFEEKVGIESFNTKGKSGFGKNSLFIGKFIYEEPNWKWRNSKTIFENDVLWNKIEEYGRNENKEQIVEEIVTEIQRYIEENCLNNA